MKTFELWIQAELIVQSIVLLIFKMLFNVINKFKSQNKW